MIAACEYRILCSICFPFVFSFDQNKSDHCITIKMEILKYFFLSFDLLINIEQSHHNIKYILFASKPFKQIYGFRPWHFPCFSISDVLKISFVLKLLFLNFNITFDSKHLIFCQSKLKKTYGYNIILRDDFFWSSWILVCYNGFNLLKMRRKTMNGVILMISSILMKYVTNRLEI